MPGFLFTQDEVGLFAVSAAFGLGFAGLIPAYVLAIRQLFPAADAFWRIPTLLLLSGSGMGTGGWLAGVLYDYFEYYAPAFAVGVAANILNFAMIAALVIRQNHVALRARLIEIGSSVRFMGAYAQFSRLRSIMVPHPAVLYWHQ